MDEKIFDRELFGFGFDPAIFDDNKTTQKRLTAIQVISLADRICEHLFLNHDISSRDELVSVGQPLWEGYSKRIKFSPSGKLEAIELTSKDFETLEFIAMVRSWLNACYSIEILLGEYPVDLQKAVGISPEEYIKISEAEKNSLASTFMFLGWDKLNKASQLHIIRKDIEVLGGAASEVIEERVKRFALDVAGESLEKFFLSKRQSDIALSKNKARRGRAEEFSLEIASERWDEDRESGILPTTIGLVAKDILTAISADLDALGLKEAPTVATVRGWIEPIAPDEASRPGRPAKK